MDSPSLKRVVEFMIAWEQEFGEYLTEEEARIRLTELVELFLLLEKPLPPNENDTKEGA